MLWEIGADGGERARAAVAARPRLRATSAGCCASLEAAGLVTVDRGGRRPAGADRAADAGGAAPSGPCSTARSDDLARSLLEPLTSAQRGRLVAAMREVERLLTAAMVDMRPATRRTATPGAACRPTSPSSTGASTRASTRRRSTGRAARAAAAGRACCSWRYLRGEPVGCGALKFHADAPAEIKRMWVAAAARGLGRRPAAARRAGGHAAGPTAARTVRLETNRALTEAIALYRSAGYREVPAVQRRALRRTTGSRSASDAAAARARDGVRRCSTAGARPPGAPRPRRCGCRRGRGA